MSDCLHRIHGEPAADPVCATLLGPSAGDFQRTSRNDISRNRCRLWTLRVPLRPPIKSLRELCTPFRDSVVAIRRGERWTETLNLRNFQSNAIFGRLREKGVYLITGGLGDLGLMIAEELAREFEARLVLLGRTPLVPPQQWKRALESSEHSRSPQTADQEVHRAPVVGSRDPLPFLAMSVAATR